jgi:hypothetical protein
MNPLSNSRQRNDAFCLTGESQVRNGYSLSLLEGKKKCVVASSSLPLSPPSHGVPTDRARPPSPSNHGCPPDEAQRVDRGGRAMATSWTSRDSSAVCGSCGGCRRRQHSPHRGHRCGAHTAWRSPSRSPCYSPAPHRGRRQGAHTVWRSPLRRSVLLACVASRSPLRRPRHSPAPRGGRRRGHPSSPPSPAPRPPPPAPVLLLPVAPLPPPRVPTLSARGTRRRKVALSGRSGEAVDGSTEASSS